MLQIFDRENFNKKTELKIHFSFLKDSFLVQHLLQKYLVLFWQKFFEETLLLNFPTQIYTAHFFIKKINRWKRQQDRILVVTNKVNFIFKNLSSLFIILFVRSKSK
jgi:hypothetical protein